MSDKPLYRVWRNVKTGNSFEEWTHTDCALDDALSLMREALKSGGSVGARPETVKHSDIYAAFVTKGPEE